jgi:hypothetical protein
MGKEKGCEGRLEYIMPCVLRKQPALKQGVQGVSVPSGTAGRRSRESKGVRVIVPEHRKQNTPQ